MYGGENGVASTKRGENFKVGMVICVNAPTLRAERTHRSWQLGSHLPPLWSLGGIVGLWAGRWSNENRVKAVLLRNFAMMREMWKERFLFIRSFVLFFLLKQKGWKRGRSWGRWFRGLDNWWSRVQEETSKWWYPERRPWSEFAGTGGTLLLFS